MNRTETWRRLERGLTPRSPTDWRRFVLLAMIFAAAYLIVGLVISLLTGDGLAISGTQTATILPYVILGAFWWRTYFQAVVDQTGGHPTDRQLRRWLIRGSIVWVVLAYVVLLVTVASYSNGDSSENRGDDNASWPLVVVFYLLPVGLAVFTAILGRMMLSSQPTDRRDPA